MARPRSYVQDVKGKTVDGLSSHRPSGRYYSIDKGGQRKYWGRDKDRAIDRYRAGLKLWPFRQTTDEDATYRLVEAGIDEDDINPELSRMAKQNRFVFNNDWIEVNPERRRLAVESIGRMHGLLDRRDEETATANTAYIQDLNETHQKNGVSLARMRLLWLRGGVVSGLVGVLDLRRKRYRNVLGWLESSPSSVRE